MEGRIDAVVLGCGTCGTFTGVARYLKKHLPRVCAVAVETQGSILGGGQPGTHKVEGIGVSFIPKTLMRSVCDEIFVVTDRRRLRHGEETGRQRRRAGGLERRRQRLRVAADCTAPWSGKRVVTIIPDSAERYLSKKIFEGGI